MKTLLTLTNELRLIMFNRISLSIYSSGSTVLPSNKVLRDLRIARKENRELDDYIDKYIKKHEQI